jgi:uncharacterized membrane protein/glutaredoxin
MIRVTLYSKPDCSLCDEARSALASLQREIPHELIVVDVERDPALRNLYGESVPVVQVGPYTLRAPFTAVDLRVAMNAAGERSRRMGKPESVAADSSRRIDRGLLFFARHWVGIFNLALLIFVGLPFLAPALMKAGATTPASWIYTAYRPFCHQMAFRTWFLFGEQAAYPLRSAGTGLTPYGEATGLDENDFYGARDFRGNEQLGYKVAFCQRDVAIYGGMLMAGLAFALFGRKMKPLPVLVWVVIGIVPIAIDGGTQILGGLPFLSAISRESTPFLRTLTGGLFGIMNIFFAYPYLQESMAETIATIVPRLQAAQAASASSQPTA